MGSDTHAVIIGGNLAGMLAASVLARHVNSVTIIERDEFPDEPCPRKGVPQSWHVHQLWSGGARLFDVLLPGVIEKLFKAGAYRKGVPESHVHLSPYGWQYRYPETQFMICCTRPLIDWVVRNEVLRNERITVRTRSEGVGLSGDMERITGVFARSLNDGSISEIPADFVIDATGRSSQLSRWLGGMGCARVQEDSVDVGFMYATRLFRAPIDVSSFPLVSIHDDHRDSHPGRYGLIFPVEGNRWLVALSGTRGAEPPGEEEEFVDFARSLRHPVIADLITRAEPLGSVRRTRTTANRRLYYDRLPQWPDGLAAVGDAIAAFNPFYGHGMVSAARAAVALDGELRTAGLVPGLAFRAIQSISAAVDLPWILGTSQDVCWPDCVINARDPRLTRHARLRQEFADRVGSLAMTESAVALAALEVSSLSGSEESLQTPEVAAALKAGPTHLPLTGPPFTDSELAMIDIARKGYSG